ncbi:MAG TPA: hypothetical protein VGR32_10155 [Brevundimonas sp.]|jgi:hypothetical protein|uniref:hypothetical protein n=1 Tax=Brevundimonas sp. TaxID=1871086 RepID=UPI002DE868C8|nr:hypothetical protein [Brevundimonas sp.]
MAEISPVVEAIYGTTNISRYLGITRAAAQRAMQRGEIQTFSVAGRTCATLEEIGRFSASVTDVQGWEGEGGGL